MLQGKAVEPRANLREEQPEEDHELQRRRRHRHRLVFDINQSQGFNEEDYDIPTEEECRFGGEDTESSFSLMTPHGRQKYLFKEPPLMNLNPDNHLSSEEVQEIINIYGCIKLQRTAIRESLGAFSRELTHQESAEICASFQALKEIIGIGCEIDIVKGEGEPSRLSPDETAWENLRGHRHAVVHFNSVLSNSSMFLQMKQVAIDNINAKLDSVHRQSRKNQASKGLYEVLKEIPGQIEEFAEEVERLLHDIEAAKHYLQDKEVTGRVLIVSV